MSWILWRALHIPPYKHPLFLRTLKIGANGEYSGWQIAAVVLLALGTLAAVLTFPPLIMVMPVALVMFYGALAGAFWTAGISGALMQERLHGHYALLGTTPAGQFAADWAICTGILHRHQGLQRAEAGLRLVLRVMAGLLLGAAILVLTAPDGEPKQLNLLMIVSGLALIGAIYVNFVQSIVHGSLNGIYVASFSRSGVEARLWAVGSFLALQALIYLASYFITVPALDALALTAGWNSMTAGLVLPAVRVALLAGVWEIANRILWWGVRARVAADPIDSHTLLDGAS